ncbi:ABC transporter permease [Fundicoccus culcitae]|uniref:Iron ABC transporter permease n=1 Tax=Fundicoccus culcitae TaxID=2969821 RepID=A0ABY5P3Y0_9LACT|nr:iron ABC transporter permease [Fundicoccus culcitae]UUX33379.1 iron ABC transporter permease [Fundicoccus culcitae]
MTMNHSNKQRKPQLHAVSSLPFMRKLVVAVVVVLVFFFFILPTLRLALMSVMGEDGFTLSFFQDILSSKRTWNVLRNTLVMILGSMTVATILGVLFAWIVAYTDIRFKKLIQLLILLPFVIPSYVLSLAWVQFFGFNGTLQRFFELFMDHVPSWNLYSMSGIIAVMGISTFPLVYLFTINTFRQIPREDEFAARISGASTWQTFRKITVPMALPGIVGGMFIAFLSSLDNFGIPAFLGTPANISVLTTYIYQQVIGFGVTAFNRAAVLSVILGLIAVVGMLLQWFALRRSRRLETGTIDYEPRVFLGKKRIVVEIFIFGFFALTTVLPLISMIMTPFLRAYGLSFTPENLTLDNYRFILTSPSTTDAIGVSLRLAGVTALVTLVLGTAIAYYRVRKNTRLSQALELAVTLPYALPGTVFALSMIFAWMQPLPGWFPGIYGSMTILYIAYMTRFLILQVRSGISAFQQIDPSVEEAARVGGTNGFGKWRRILLPLITPTVIGGSLLVFLSALTELTVSSLLYSSNSETIGVSILSFQQSGYTLYSTAFSSLIVILIIGAYGLLLLFQWMWNRKVVNK